MVLPPEFERYTQMLMGDSLYASLVRVLDEEPTAFVRLNPLKRDTLSMAVPATQVPWCGHGYALQDRPAFTFDPLFHAGLYYVQEQSSMFLSQVLRQFVRHPVRMLDMCAAPGGKSTLARMLLPEGSTLFCNEPIGTRAQILSENMQKCGHPEVMVVSNLPHEIRQSGLTFGVILCDVPCSGEGMFRKNANAMTEWSVENVGKCQRLQREIVAEAWQCLDEGGLLIYSTCTFNARENEENVAWICQELGATLLSVDINDDWDIAPALWMEGVTPQVSSLKPQSSKSSFPVYRFIPGYRYEVGKRYGEGLFMAVMRKGGDGKIGQHHVQQRKDDRKKASKTKGCPADWLIGPDSFSYYVAGNELRAIPRTLVAQYEKAVEKLHVLSAGITLGTQKGRDLIPCQSLALSICLNQGAFTQADLSYANALSYLRKEAIQLPSGTPRGFVLVTYRGIPLGFVKNVGHRANNLYPNEWRIRSTHLPQKEIRIIDI